PSQIGFHFFTPEKRIPAPYYSKLHKKGRASGDKGHGERSSGKTSVSAAWHRSCNVHSRRRQIRLGIGKPSPSPSGKIRKGVQPGIVGSHCDHLRRSRRDGQRFLRVGGIKSGPLVQHLSSRHPQKEIPFTDSPSPQFYFPYPALYISIPGKKIKINFLGHLERSRLSVINQKLCSPLRISLGSRLLGQRADPFARG